MEDIFNQSVEFIKDNYLYTSIGLGGLLLMIIVLCCCCRKRDKQPKNKVTDYMPKIKAPEFPIVDTDPLEQHKNQKDFWEAYLSYANSERENIKIHLFSSWDPSLVQELGGARKSIKGKKNGEIDVLIIPPTKKRLASLYNDYKDCLEEDGFSVNEKVLWHSTKTKCEKSNLTFCDDKKCTTCTICSQGFKLQKDQTNMSNGAYDHGLYFAELSSKANYYIEYTNSLHGIRTLILCQVATGNPYTPVEGKEFEDLPQDFHCLVDSKNDEIVVFDNNAALPLYIVIYTMYGDPEAEKWQPETQNVLWEDKHKDAIIRENTKRSLETENSTKSGESIKIEKNQKNARSIRNEKSVENSDSDIEMEMV